MAEECPAHHTPMENHHLHGCLDYETSQPKAPRKKLMSDWGLDRKRETISTTTNNSNKRAKSEEEKRVPPPTQTQRQTTPPGNLESENHQSAITTNQAAKGEVCTTKRPCVLNASDFGFFG